MPAPSNHPLIAELPEGIGERSRIPGQRDSALTGEFVLYWLHHAMRAHENPALDAAVAIANHRQLPLLVYQAVPERAPYASDRHHTFVLEGARDLQRQFRKRGINYSLHVERRGHRRKPLSALAERAAVVVTEDLPVRPWQGWTDKLATAISTPLVRVDTACVAPMLLVGRSYDRAFQFRQATQQLYEDRLDRDWRVVDLVGRDSVIDLPFEPVDLRNEDLSQLISECEIDHSIGRVPHTPGGTTAGYDRWNAFRRTGLIDYDRRRNDPLAHGTSRLSAYLHYGMVSPFRIARECSESGTRGSDKFLDELLIWRELAYAFCFYRSHHETLNALPKWAQDTLDKHSIDPRPVIHSWETLARGRTGEMLWDAAQKSLLIHGELHNNVRMTWGKALLEWTRDPETALSMMIDLNHRYALDGRDPASYGGILWCLGQFDRPFPPARPISGTIRTCSTADHAVRLDPERYLNHTTRSVSQPNFSVAVIGAGISGLMCARTLLDHGIDVKVFEKARGVGGRMSTRRTEDGLQFDHGAQYFTVKDARFERYVKSWMADGVVDRWDSHVVTLNDGSWEPRQQDSSRFVAVPGMTALCRHLAADLHIQLRIQVAPPVYRNGQWRLADREGTTLGDFDCVISTAPASQSMQLLEACPVLQDKIGQSVACGCWAAMIAFERSLELPFDGAFVRNSPLGWIACNTTKPGRPAGNECWVLHADAEWSTDHLESQSETVFNQLVDAFWKSTGCRPRQTIWSAIHRWRYARFEEPLKVACLFEIESRLGACGDWCNGPRVEDAFLSGVAMAGRVLSSVTQNGG